MGLYMGIALKYKRKQRKKGTVTFIFVVAVAFQPRSQGLSSSCPLERERDPGMVWSRMSD